MTLIERGEVALALLSPDEQLEAFEYLQALADLASQVGRTQQDVFVIWLNTLREEQDSETG